MSKIKGIIFDMDNTLLRSCINFEHMKRDIYSFLCDKGILPAGFEMSSHTTSTITTEAMNTGRMTDELSHNMWNIAKEHDIRGMIDADLEEGSRELLQELHGKFHLAVVTNNAVEAAIAALEDNQIACYFDLIVGRESVTSLKPAPDGYLKVLSHFSNTLAEEWLSVGDAWIDGKASESAGIPFIAYRGDIAKMNSLGVFPSEEIQDVREVSRIINHNKKSPNTLT